MPNTGLGTPYIVSTDLVANYPTVSSDLADHIDEVSVNSFATATARSTAIPSPVEGQVSYLEDINIVEAYTGAAWTPVSKILQIVRATDTTRRDTTSSSFVDVTGVSVTITPQKSTSAIIIVAALQAESDRATAGDSRIEFQITDSSNNAISGAQAASVRGSSLTTVRQYINLWAYATPSTTSATTYKVRFRAVVANVTASVLGGDNTSQIYAIEVSA